MKKYKLGDIATVEISGVDKKITDGEKEIRLCNFVDVYYNWAITIAQHDSFMFATARPNEISKFQLKKGQVALTKDSETRDDIGISTYIADDFEDVILGYHCALISPNKDILDGRYLNAFLHTDYAKKYFACNASGSGQRYALSVEALNSFPVPIIPLYEQKQIGEIFSALDKKIELNRQINRNLAALAKQIYDHWFVQFDFPDENGRPYRLSGGAMEYNKAMKRLIPSEWKVESVVDNSITSVIKPGVKPFNTKTYLATADVNGTSISTGNRIEYETREGRANMQPTTYSVWFAKMKNSVKHLYLNPAMSPVIENTILSTGFCGLQCDEVAFEYTASYIEHSYFETMKNILAHGATQEAVNNDDMTSIPLAIPSLDVLQRYHESTRHLYAQISNNICENYQLAQLRDWLLPMLMNGQATISD